MPTRKANYFESSLIAPENISTRLFALPVRYVPTLISAIETRKSRSFWETDEDFVRGYNILTDIQIMLLTPQDSYGLEQYNRLTQLYMLLDSIYNGSVYTSITTSDGVVIPSPEIPGSPAQSPNPNIAPGLRQQLLNAQGNLNTGYFNGPARPATMADVVRTGQIQTDAEQGIIPDAVEDFVDLIVSGGGSASDAIASLLQTSGDFLSDGGVVATQLASSAALMAVLGLQGAQLDTLIASINTLTERVGFLSGVLPPDPVTFGTSLPDYLTQSVALRPTGVQGSQASLQSLLNLIAADAGNTVGELSLLRTQNNVNLSAVVALLRQLLGLEAVTDPIVGASLLVLAQCICNNTGDIADNTAPSTQQLNPAPDTSVCQAYASAPWVRVTDFVEVGTTSGEVPLTIWRADFNDSSIPFVRLTGSTGRPFYRAKIGERFDHCLAWNWTNNQMNDDYARDMATTASVIENSNAFQLFSAAMPIGSRSEQIAFAAPGNQVNYFCWNWARPVELGKPPLNMFLRGVSTVVP